MQEAVEPKLQRRRHDKRDGTTKDEMAKLSVECRERNGDDSHSPPPPALDPEQNTTSHANERAVEQSSRQSQLCASIASQRMSSIRTGGTACSQCECWKHARLTHDARSKHGRQMVALSPQLSLFAHCLVGHSVGQLLVSFWIERAAPKQMPYLLSGSICRLCRGMSA